MPATNSKFESHVQVDNSEQRPVDLLCEASHLSRQKVKQLMFKGAAWLSRGRQTDRIRRSNKRLKQGDVLHLYHDPLVLEMQPAPAQMIADEGAYSVWNKPYGMLSQGSKWGDHCTINRWVETHLLPQRPAFVVHRLDRAANGLILIAHGKGAAAALSELFQKRRIDKRYEVIVHGCFSDHPLPLMLDNPVDGREAVSHVLRATYDTVNQRSTLAIRIETGRKHQIRKHLSDFGFPVVGDRLYGLQTPEIVGESGENLQLSCNHLAFRCPLSGAEKIFELPAIPG